MNTDEIKLTRHYIVGSEDELHLRQYESGGSGKPLMLLHPAPYSGAWFDAGLEYIRSPEVLFVPDYPGYGGSTGPEDLPDIRYIAEAMLEILFTADVESCNLLGFHTGCLVAAEMALLQPELIDQLVLIDVPYFTGPMRETMYESGAAPNILDDDLECLRKSFEFCVSGKLDFIDYDRAFELFVEQLRPGRKAHYAFHAAFSYNSEAAFKKLQHPGAIFATKSGLLEPTRDAAKALSHMTFTERPDIERGVFEGAAEITGKAIDEYLESTT